MDTGYTRKNNPGKEHIMKKQITFMLLIIHLLICGSVSAHHQIAYLAPCDGGMVAFMSSGHKLPMGEGFSGLDSYEETVVIDPGGRKNPLKNATEMGAFGFSCMPLSEKGLHVLGIAAEHYGTITTTGYFRGTRKEALKAGKTVVDSKHTFRYSKSCRWNGDGPAPGLRLGHDIEIVPDTVPMRLKKGDRLSVTLYFMDRPAADTIIGFSSMKRGGEIAHPEETDKFIANVITGENGKADLEMLESGWMIFTAEKLTLNPQPDVDKLYHSTTLTIWVEDS